MERELGFFERYSLSRTLLAVPPLLVFTASFPVSSSSRRVTSADISNAIPLLLAKFPLLSSSIEGARTRNPRFKTRVVSVDEVLKLETGASRSGEDALLLGIAQGATLDVEKGPLWGVIWAPSNGIEGDGARDMLILHLNHVVADGQGTAVLLAELLKLLRLPPVVEQIAMDSPLPPSLESSIDCRPSYTALLSLVYGRYVKPRLPILPFLAPEGPPPPLVPIPTPLPPRSQPTALRLALFPSSLIVSLKSAGRAHGVQTLHPLLHTCMLSALVLASPSSSPSTFILGTPISLRSPAVQHPNATGNYACSISSTYHSLTSSDPFWALCLSYAKRISSPEERARSTRSMGMMRFIPDKPLEDGDEETGWEKQLRASMEAKEPYGSSAEVSNVGVLPETGWEAEGVEVAWAQAAKVVRAPLTMSVSYSLFFLFRGCCKGDKRGQC